jgi:FkbM family methyltransferase
LNRWLDRFALPILRGPLKGKRWLLATRINFFLGTYEVEQTRAFLATVQPGQVVYDCGAHYGYYTLLAALPARAGHVFAFEPSPRNLLRLRRHVAINGCRNVTVLDVAVSDHEGKAHFEDRAGSGVGHLSPEGPMEVPITSLDALAGRLPPPHVLKIDVEGAEMSVLAGARALLTTAKPAIFLSVHSASLQTQCTDFLQGLTYSLQPLGEAELLAKPAKDISWR